MARESFHPVIPSVYIGPGRYLFLILVLLLSGCNTQNLREESDPAVVRARADTAYRNEDWHAAERDYLYLVNHATAGAEDWFRLGNIYARTDRPDEAVAAYREALNRDQGNSDAWYNLAMLQLRQATQTFIDMVNHTDVNDDLNLRARYAVTAITEMLENRFNMPGVE